MQDNTPLGGASNGEQLRSKATDGDTQKVTDHLRAAGSAATEALRNRAGAASSTLREKAQAAKGTVRSRANEAGTWARGQLSNIQGRVESQPTTAALWALGIGVAAGILLTALFRGDRR